MKQKMKNKNLKVLNLKKEEKNLERKNEIVH
jgi:hypothetical protein